MRALKPPELPAATMLATFSQKFSCPLPPTLLMLDWLLHELLVGISFRLVPPTNEVVGR